MSLVVYKSNQRKRVQGRRQMSATPVSVRPPQYMANPAGHRLYRYQCTTAGNYNITNKAVGQSLGMMCLTSTTAASVMTAFRVRRIRVWGPALSTAAITWFGDQNLNFESNREVSDTSTSEAFVPYVSAVPPRGSSAAMWQAVGSNWSSDVLFELIVASAAVIDIEVDFVLADGPASPTSTLAISGGVAGKLAYPPLDGYGGGFLPAVGKTPI